MAVHYTIYLVTKKKANLSNGAEHKKVCSVGYSEKYEYVIM